MRTLKKQKVTSLFKSIIALFAFSVFYFNAEAEALSAGDASKRNVDIPWVFVITASKFTSTRIAELTRLGESLAHVENLKWIVVEDAETLDPAVYEMLERKRQRLGLDSVYLSATAPKSACRGTVQRDAGLQWLLDRIWPATEITRRRQDVMDMDFLRKSDVQQSPVGPYAQGATELRPLGENSDRGRFNESYVYTAPGTSFTRYTGGYNDHGQQQSDWPLMTPANGDFLRFSGVVYFADDDNTFDSDLFDEIRYTQRVSLFPVGLVTSSSLSTPIVNVTTGEVLGFYDGWIADRVWPVDMAGFAVSVDYMFQLHPERDHWFFPTCRVAGRAETNWLLRVGLPEVIVPEAKVGNATQIHVWHTKSRRPKLGSPIFQEFQRGTNLEALARSPNIDHQEVYFSSRDKKATLPVALIPKKRT